jgi:hypothetical protein
MVASVYFVLAVASSADLTSTTYAKDSIAPCFMSMLTMSLTVDCQEVGRCLAKAGERRQRFEVGVRVMPDNPFTPRFV